MEEETLIPTFSLEERERRWDRVRQLMTAEQLNCLVGFPSQGRFEQFHANTRYLIQIGGFMTEAAVVFPLEGDVTAIVQTPRDVEWWGAIHHWIKDLRASRRNWADPIINRLKELRLERARIGVIGLKGLLRAPEGIVPWYMFEKVKEALPNAEFVNATPLLLKARSVKTAEEISFVERAEEVAEKAVETMAQTVRVGVRENVVYAAMIQTMISHGAELPTMIYWSAGQERSVSHLVPTTRKLRAGDLLTNEIEAKWGGYIAQVVAPAFIGAVPAQHRSTYETSMKIFQALCPRMRPGASLASLSKDYQTMARDAGYKPAAWLFHGRGLGDDLPAVPTPTVESEEKLEEGNVLILKPGLVPMNGRDEGSVRAGETVVVTKDGARRLGKRRMEVIEIPAS